MWYELKRLLSEDLASEQKTPQKHPKTTLSQSQDYHGHQHLARSVYYCEHFQHTCPNELQPKISPISPMNIHCIKMLLQESPRKSLIITAFYVTFEMKSFSETNQQQQEK